MLRREADKAEVRTQGIELLISRLKARGVGREGFGRDVDLVGLVVTSVPKVTLRKAFNFKVVCGYANRKSMKYR
jgi:hypothetical protein